MFTTKRILEVVLIIIILILSNNTGICEEGESSEFHSYPSIKTIAKPIKWTITAGYWNDNFVLDKIFNQEVNQGNDDHVTASFWLQSGFKFDNKWLFFDVFQNIITNKKDSTRTDLLTFRPSLVLTYPHAIFRIGLGFIATGNFAGEAIQNGYHNTFGYEEVNLGYIGENNIGLVGLLKFKPIFYENEKWLLNGFLINSVRSGVGPSNYRLGLELSVEQRLGMGLHPLEIQGQVGFIDYYHLEDYLEPHFKEGICAGVLVSSKLFNSARFNCWITSNQYGLNQPHFGFSLTIGNYINRIHDLSDVSFP
jgi:hypothetical protein